MKSFLLTICLLVFSAVVPLCAQETGNDVIVLKNGVRIVGHIYNEDNENYYYRLGDEDFEYLISKQKVKEVRRGNIRMEKVPAVGAPSAITRAYDRIEQVNEDFYINHTYCDKSREYSRLVDRQWHLNGWMRFCKIYGTISIIVGITGLGISSSPHNDSNNSARNRLKNTSIASIVEGGISYYVGSILYRKCEKTRAEIMHINEVGLPVSEYRVGGVSLEPSVNLLSDRETHERAMGVGLRLTF